MIRTFIRRLLLLAVCFPPVFLGAQTATDPFALPVLTPQVVITSNNLYLKEGVIKLTGNVKAVQGSDTLTCQIAYFKNDPLWVLATETPHLYRKEDDKIKKATRETTVDALTIVYQNQGTPSQKLAATGSGTAIASSGAKSPDISGAAGTPGTLGTGTSTTGFAGGSQTISLGSAGIPLTLSASGANTQVGQVNPGSGSGSQGVPGTPVLPGGHSTTGAVLPASSAGSGSGTSPSAAGIRVPSESIASTAFQSKVPAIVGSFSAASIPRALPLTAFAAVPGATGSAGVRSPEAVGPTAPQGVGGQVATGGAGAGKPATLPDRVELKITKNPLELLKQLKAPQAKNASGPGGMASGYSMNNAPGKAQQALPPGNLAQAQQALNPANLGKMLTPGNLAQAQQALNPANLGKMLTPGNLAQAQQALNPANLGKVLTPGNLAQAQQALNPANLGKVLTPGNLAQAQQALNPANLGKVLTPGNLAQAQQALNPANMARAQQGMALFQDAERGLLASLQTLGHGLVWRLPWKRLLGGALSKAVQSNVAGLFALPGVDFSKLGVSLPQGLSQGLTQGLAQGLAQGLPSGLTQGLTQGLQGLPQGLTQSALSALTQSAGIPEPALAPPSMEMEDQRIPEMEASGSVTVRIDERTWDLATHTWIIIQSEMMRGFQNPNTMKFYGDVRVKDKEHFGRGRRLTYDKASNTVILQGDAYIETERWNQKEKKLEMHILNGETVIYNLETKQAHSE